jgi:predicted PhzF superfamily epimerase YddE/YHI9
MSRAYRGAYGVVDVFTGTLLLGSNPIAVVLDAEGRRERRRTRGGSRAGAVELEGVPGPAGTDSACHMN